MYCIKKDDMWLCGSPCDLAYTKSLVPPNDIIIRDSGYEIDKIMQEVMSYFGDYSLRVYRLRTDQLEDLVLRKLRGY